MEASEQTINNPHIVGIGASAGGLEALGFFFDNCPEDANIAFVIVQHLSPDYKSMMSNLLARHTNMEVSVAKDQAKLEPNKVYLIPVDRNLTVKDGAFHLMSRAPRNEINLPIDVFFESLAKEEKERAIGVILSGTGSDGTIGSRAIKDVGGVIFVQEPETTRFNGMPMSVIESGLADYNLPATEIPLEIRNYIEYPESARDLLSKDVKDEQPIEEILLLLKRNTNYNFLEYRRQTLTRRILKRLKINKLERLENYLTFLRDNEEEQEILVKEFLIGVTNFFRDPQAFKTLETQVIPEILEKAKEEQRDIKIWSVGCSTGEEAYSIAISLEKVMADTGSRVNYKIFATDIDSRAIDTASKGIYHSAIETDMTKDVLVKYFTKKPNSYQVKSNVRKNIIFSRHDILHNPPFNKMDLVSCRNMLIYFETSAQKKALSRLHFALNLRAYLFLGPSESLGVFSKSFKPINRKLKIFQSTKLASKLDLVSTNIANLYPPITSSRKSRNSLKEQLEGSINNNLMDAVNGVCICVNQHYDIVHAVGDMNRYGSLPSRGFSNNIENILPIDFTIPITNGIKELQNTAELHEVAKNIQFVNQNKSISVKLFITHASLSGQSTTPIYVVTLVELERTEYSAKPVDLVTIDGKKYQREIKELKQALANTRESLQLTIEELETSNEEIQATNEELVASNEELQSTNEELQSVNEELHTVNSELQEKNAELLEANSDIENLINSTDIGTIFLDKEFRLRRFTPAMSEQIELQIGDIGRHIQNFSWADPDLLENAKKVLKTLQPVKKEIQLKNGTWYLQQILPYRTQDDLIDGVIINFVQIQSFKDSVAEIEELNYFLEEVDSVSPAINYIYDLETRSNVYSSRSIAEILGYTKEEIKGYGDSLIAKLMVEEELPKIVAHHEKLRNQKSNESQFIEYQMRRKDGSLNWLISYDKPFKRNEQGTVTQIIGVAQNITEEKHLRLERERLSRLFESITNVSPAIIYILDIENCKIDFANAALCELLDCEAEEIYQWRREEMELFLHPDDVPVYQNHSTMMRTLAHDSMRTVEYRLKDKHKKYCWMSASEKVFERDENGKPTKLIGIALDESQQKAYQQ